MGWSSMTVEHILPFSRYVKLSNSRYILEGWKQRSLFVHPLPYAN